MNLNVYVACSSDPRDYKEAFDLGARGILTNANLLLKYYGEDMSLKDSARKMLKESDPLMTVFQSIHGRTCDEIYRKAMEICVLDRKRIGFKIVCNTEGFKAMRKLSSQNIKVIATGMFTCRQAYMAAAANCYAISPFVGRGNKAGYDMFETIRNIRALYDCIEGRPVPEILAASIHNKEEAMQAFIAGADAVAVDIATLKDFCNDPNSLRTEKAFGAAFDKIKGEDASYLKFDSDDHNYEE